MFGEIEREKSILHFYVVCADDCGGKEYFEQFEQVSDPNIELLPLPCNSI